MHRVLKIAVVLVMLVGLIGTADATTNILYFTDGVQGTDRMAEALANLVAGGGYSVTTVPNDATGPVVFATQIATPGAYNLGIFMVQTALLDSGDYDGGITALGAFVAAGGRSIYTNCGMDEGGSYAALFGAAWTGYSIATSFGVTDPLATGITNPVGLNNPGYAYYAMGVSVPAGVDGLVAATFLDVNGNLTTEGAIVISNIGEGGRSITNGFLTDTFVGDGSQGVQLYINEIKYLTNQVPLPGAVWLLGSGLLGLSLLRGRMRKD